MLFQENCQAYFVFVEETSDLGDVTGFDGPDGSLLRVSDLGLPEEIVRARMSGVERESFMEGLETFEQLRTGEISAKQRARRQEHLDALFKYLSVPTIDLMVAKSDGDYPALDYILTPASWHLAIIELDSVERDPKPVFISDRDENEEMRRGRLVTILPVFPPIELRLRDIFSLNHIRDASINGEEGGEDGEPALMPIDPSGSGPESDSTSDFRRDSGYVNDYDPRVRFIDPGNSSGEV